MAVRLAINPLLNKQDSINEDTGESLLVELRDMGVLSNSELEEVIKLYKRMEDKEQAKKQYQTYEIILRELKEIGYFTDTQYANRTDLLKNISMLINSCVI